MIGCNGICEKHKGKRKNRTMYNSENVFCSNCNIFIRKDGGVDGKRCKCCKKLVRHTPSTGGQKMRENLIKHDTECLV